MHVYIATIDKQCHDISVLNCMQLDTHPKTTHKYIHSNSYSNVAISHHWIASLPITQV